MPYGAGGSEANGSKHTEEGKNAPRQSIDGLLKLLAWQNWLLRSSFFRLFESYAVHVFEEPLELIPQAND